MTDELRGNLDASGLRVGVVRSLFNRAVTDGLLEGALAILDQAGAHDVTVVAVEGAFETPLVAQNMTERGYDAIVVLGAVVEGETDHYEHIAGRASEGLMRVMLDTGVPISFGILTVRDPARVCEKRPRRAQQGSRSRGSRSPNREPAEAAWQ